MAPGRSDRVALILPGNADFVFAFPGRDPRRDYPGADLPPTDGPPGLSSRRLYLENTLHIVAKAAPEFLLTNAEVKRMLQLC
jgi:hypothetical protein